MNREAWVRKHRPAVDVATMLKAILRGNRTVQDEAEISINGVALTDAESMTVRVAIDTLANVLSEGLEEQEGRAMAQVYMASLSRIQELLESRKPRTQ